MSSEKARLLKLQEKIKSLELQVQHTIESANEASKVHLAQLEKEEQARLDAQFHARILRDAVQKIELYAPLVSKNPTRNGLLVCANCGELQPKHHEKCHVPELEAALKNINSRLPVTVEIRCNSDGTLDEVVASVAGQHVFHLEQQDNHAWWMRVTTGEDGEGVSVNLYTKTHRGPAPRIHAFVDDERGSEDGRVV